MRAFRVLVRNAMFRRVELAALRRYDLLGELDADAGCDADVWAEAMAGYWAEHDVLLTGADARGPALLQVAEGARPGRCARSSTTRPATTTGASRRRVDLAASDEAGAAVVTVTAVDRLDGGWTAED